MTPERREAVERMLRGLSERELLQVALEEFKVGSTPEEQEVAILAGEELSRRRVVPSASGRS